MMKKHYKPVVLTRPRFFDFDFLLCCMSRPHSIPIWKKTPFIRLLVPFIAGIMLQSYIGFSLPVIIITIVSFTIAFFLFRLFPFALRFKWKALQGLMLNMMLLGLGLLITWQKDIRHDANWYGNNYHDSDYLVIRINEPLTEKPKSFKTEVYIEAVIHDDSVIHCKGKLLVYLSKDSIAQQLRYGDKILIHKDLQAIKNSGNPGAFDYKQYLLFRGITSQVYLNRDEFVVLKEKNEEWLDKFLFSIREKVINTIHKYVPGEKEQGLAEAILIGYKDDLDKNLEQSYINTGVVHIIVIAGLHLGMVYWVLMLFTRGLRKRKNLKWLSAVIIIPCLWIFSLATGAHPPVMRAALMLTCIVFAECLQRKTSVYNTLALTAFLLLCYDPFWLWDAGFQLSYAAVVSIVTFMRPIYNRVYIKNKALDLIWKINAVSIAAQILTIPFSIYHFHQFPNFFLLTNFVAVPLGMGILLGEIFLCLISFMQPLAFFAGHILSWLIWLMNSYIERIDSLPFSVWSGLQITIAQAAILIIMIAGLSYWLLKKEKSGVWVGVISLLIFSCLRNISFYQSGEQRKIIVYNIPKYRAIDFVDGRNYFFIGDAYLQQDDLAHNFYLKPSRTLFRITPSGSLNDFWHNGNCIRFNDKCILLLDSSVSFRETEHKIVVDVLVISKKPRIYITKLTAALAIKLIVFDGSVPPWKAGAWKKDCHSLHIPYYDVAEKGAFVMNLD